MKVLKKVKLLIIAACLSLGTLLPASVNAAAESNVTESVKGAKQQEQKISIVVLKKAGALFTERKVELLGGNITSRWDFINSFAVEISEDKLDDVRKLSGVLAVNLDGEVVPTNAATIDATKLKTAYPIAVKADFLWKKGITGKGVTVAVLDSGIDTMKGKEDFSGRVIDSVKINSSTNYTADKFGHGTHVAGIIGGDGTVARDKYIGIAPEVSLINVKISDDLGKSSERDLVNGLQWVFENKDKYNIRVVNISAQISTKQSYKESATAAAVEMLWNAGVVVVVSAGNRGGESCSTCYAPANDPFVITVGAVDDGGTKQLEDDFVKSWSAMGTTLDGHNKPDIVAPGAHIISYMPSGEIRKLKPENIRDKEYFEMGGTSMSAPIVTGTVALMLQANPQWTPNQVKYILQQTARSYKQQPEGSPGIVSADKAVFYNGVVGEANQGLSYSPLITPSSADGSFSNVSWANVSWANVSWANVSWANAYDY